MKSNSTRNMERAACLLRDLTNPMSGLVQYDSVKKPATVSKQLRLIADLIDSARAKDDGKPR